MAAIVCALTRSEAGSPPNVLFLLSDDQRPDTIAAVGNPHISTPHLDRLAQRGVSFQHAYIMGGLQGAVCVPSRAMLFTSRGLFQVREDLAAQATWPEQFAKAGYRTFITGKWHNGPTSLTRVFQEGRKVFLGGMSDAYGMSVRDFSNGELGPPHTNAAHHTVVFADSAIQFLGEHPAERPFLCYVAFKVPHDPRIATTAWHERYRANPPPLPGNVLPVHPFNNGEMTVRDEQLLPWPRSPDAVRAAWADYYACISHLDEQIGRVFDALRQRGFETNTLVVFAGDNGLALGSHGLLGKQNLYEHSVGVPLLMAGPGIPSGIRVKNLCYLLDVFPTLAEFAGVRGLSDVEGVSLVPALNGRAVPSREALLFAYRAFQRGVRNDRWKLIRYPNIDKTQLFDLQRDPAEREDVSGVPGNRRVVEEMMGLMKDLQVRFGDRLPLRVSAPESGAWVPPPPGKGL